MATTPISSPTPRHSLPVAQKHWATIVANFDSISRVQIPGLEVDPSTAALEARIQELEMQNRRLSKEVAGYRRGVVFSDMQEQQSVRELNGAKETIGRLVMENAHLHAQAQQGPGPLEAQTLSQLHHELLAKDAALERLGCDYESLETRVIRAERSLAQREGELSEKGEELGRVYGSCEMMHGRVLAAERKLKGLEVEVKRSLGCKGEGRER